MMKIILKLLALVFILSGCSENEEKSTQEISDRSEVKNIVENSISIIDQAKILTEMKWLNLDIKEDLILGNLDSGLIIVEYFSPTCPSCSFYHSTIFPEIKQQYIDTAKIAYVLREFVTNKQDLDAAILARCNGDKEDRFTFIKLLLQYQNSWAFTKQYSEILKNIGSIGGVSPEQYKNCMQNDNMIKILFKNAKILSFKHNAGIPVFFFNGKKFTKDYTYDNFSKEIKNYIKEEEEKQIGKL